MFTLSATGMVLRGSMVCWQSDILLVIAKLKYEFQVALGLLTIY